jgi:hypothetical protein
MKVDIDKVKTIAKIANLPKILEAASFLYSLDLLPSELTAQQCVKQYVKANPDINQEIMGNYQ